MAKTDGRKRRWHQHKVERRTELVDGALDAIRRRGRDVSMDEIAAEIGVSKTVLYRYFVDKNDLTTAVMMRFAQTTLIPNMAAALSAEPRRFRPHPRDHPGLRRDCRRRTGALPVRDGEQFGQQEQSHRRLRADHRPDAGGGAAAAHAAGRDGHPRGGAVGVPDRRRRPAGHPLVDVEPPDEQRRPDRLPDDAVLERAVRHRRGRRLAGEVQLRAAPVAGCCRPRSTLV